MQISEISGNRVKISLTDTEVICCFGAYESLFDMTPKTKLAIKTLLNEVIEKHYGTGEYEKISAVIRGGQNIGCTIIISCEKSVQEYILTFNNSENLIKSAKDLHRFLKNKQHTSSLYRENNKYYLLIRTVSKRIPYTILQKYTYDILYDSISYEHIREYATLVSGHKAIEKLAVAFFKET